MTVRGLLDNAIAVLQVLQLLQVVSLLEHCCSFRALEACDREGRA